MNEIQVPEVKPVILPLISPTFNWDTFIRDGFTHTGQRFNAALDHNGIKPKQDQSIIIALAEFYRITNYALEPFKEIRQASIILQQLFFSFLCVYNAATFVDIVIKTELKAFPHNTESTTWVIGGNMLQWKKAIIECCSVERNYNTRFLMNCFLVLFQCNGYQTVFDNYSKTSLVDGTFTLHSKEKP